MPVSRSKAYSIVFSDVSLDQPLSSSLPGVAQAIERVIVTDIAKARGGHVEEQVRAALIDALPTGQVEIDDVASSLRINRGKLQRCLQHEQTSFRAVLDALRQELIRAYIRDPRLCLNEIGFLLGFSDQSAFTRSFKRWFGSSPQRFRDQHPN